MSDPTNSWISLFGGMNEEMVDDLLTMFFETAHKKTLNGIDYIFGDHEDD